MTAIFFVRAPGVDSGMFSAGIAPSAGVFSV